MYGLSVLFLCYGLMSRTSADESVYESCGNLDPQEKIDMKSITGVWHVIEIIQHKIDESRYDGRQYDSPICPHIFITQGSESELKLFWSEEKGEVEYKFKINDLTMPGFWESTGPQNGTLLQLKYEQFAGTVHVRKAVGDHMVLTFCSPKSQLYSLVVARDKKLDPIKVKSITDHMHKLKLPITEMNHTCRNSSTASRAALWLVTAMAFCFAITRTRNGSATM